MSQTQVEQRAGSVGPADSIEGEDPHNEQPGKKQKSRRPANTAFRQQRLKAWQPILTPKTVLPIFFALGIIFAPIGGLLLWASASVQELIIDYTDCNSTATSEFQPVPDSKVSSSFKSANGTVRPQWRKTLNTTHPPYSVEIENTPVCTLQFSIPNDIGPPVYLYYRLTNFYQNHRRYVKSLDTDQLKGDALSNSTIKGSSCNPLRLDHNGKAYYPCGLIANSIFNDTLNSPVAVNAAGGQSSQQYRMTNKSIAWSSDASLYKKTKYTNDQVSPPPNWQRRYPDGYTDENPIPDLSEYEEFQVWMRTAGLPTFSKLALRNDQDTMTAGIYQMDIYDFFPVQLYDGTKSILISTRTVVGGKNSFLGIAYVVVGGLCIVLGVLFTVAHLIKPRKLGDHTYLSWNNDTPATAVSTGREVRPGGA
ncbi:alkylphosphocholine resistance protein lem3 [Exophiala dermatitidis]|uniref:LEM3/CDC50 family protein n=2 Tax=Exophiala dermatitidis TaxID=5970 RepID=H6BWG7_EXODN